MLFSLLRVIMENLCYLNENLVFFFFLWVSMRPASLYISVLSYIIRVRSDLRAFQIFGVPLQSQPATSGPATTTDTATGSCLTMFSCWYRCLPYILCDPLLSLLPYRTNCQFNGDKNSYLQFSK